MSAVNLHRPSTEMINENVAASAKKERLLLIGLAQNRINNAKQECAPSEMYRKVHALSGIDDHLFRQSLNDLVG